MMQIISVLLFYILVCLYLYKYLMVYIHVVSQIVNFFVWVCIVLATEKSSSMTWTYKHCTNADKYIERGESCKCKGQHGKKFS